jgi:hypothetical protein
LIPHTIIVANGTTTHWYFTSQKAGVVLKKNYSKRNPTEIFNALFKESPLANNIVLGTGVRGDPNDHHLSMKNVIRAIATMK